MLFEVVSQTDGLDPEAAKEYLETEQGYDDVLKAVEAARLEGIHSIPVFVYGNRHVHTYTFARTHKRTRSRTRTFTRARTHTNPPS